MKKILCLLLVAVFSVPVFSQEADSRVPVEKICSGEDTQITVLTTVFKSGKYVRQATLRSEVWTDSTIERRWSMPVTVENEQWVFDEKTKYWTEVIGAENGKLKLLEKRLQEVKNTTVKYGKEK